MKNKVLAKKLLMSKWTALAPTKKEKHFIVSHCSYDEDNKVEQCIITAVYSGNEYDIDWQSLKDSTKWKMGWK